MIMWDNVIIKEMLEIVIRLLKNQLRKQLGNYYQLKVFLRNIWVLPTRMKRIHCLSSYRENLRKLVKKEIEICKNVQVLILT